VTSQQPERERPVEPAAANDPVQAGDPVQPGTPALRRPRRLWIAAAVLAISALVGGIAWAVRPQPAPDAVAAATPQQAVTGFLQALAAGDAERALRYAATVPTDTSLLTREVLDVSHEEAPLAIVNVPEVPGGGPVQVPAAVTFGDQPATITFSVNSTEQGWRLGQVTSTIDPGTLPSALGATLNGATLTNPSHLEVFPGVYTFGEKVPEITLKGARVVVAAVGEDVRAGLQPTLTDTGVKTANRIAANAVAACMKQRDPAPKGCPNSVTVSVGQKVNAKTIRWNLVGDPWKNATYTLDVNDPTQARGAATLTFRFRCTLTQNGETYMVDQTNSVDVRYMLTVTDPKVAVVWQRIT
jgi:hypothetical protein